MENKLSEFLGLLDLGVAQLRKWSNRQPHLDAVIEAQAVSFTIVGFNTNFAHFLISCRLYSP